MSCKKFTKLLLVLQVALLPILSNATIDLGGSLIGSDGKAISVANLVKSTSIQPPSYYVSNSIISPTINIENKTIVQNGKAVTIPQISVNGSAVTGNIVVNNSINIGDKSSLFVNTKNDTILVGNMLIGRDVNGNLTQTKVDPNGSQAAAATIFKLPPKVPTNPQANCSRSINANSVNGTFSVVETCPGKGSVLISTGSLPKPNTLTTDNSVRSIAMNTPSTVSTIKLNPAPVSSSRNLITLK